jgi:replicative DNA helicase
VDLVLAKNRFGDTGMVPLVFRPDLGDLREEVAR